MQDDFFARTGITLLDQVEGAEKLFLSGRRSREADLESAVKFFLEFLRGFESVEDDPVLATEDLQRLELMHKDVVVGITASGRTPTRSAMMLARVRGGSRSSGRAGETSGA